jgi:hypothetical protein
MSDPADTPPDKPAPRSGPQPLWMTSGGPAPVGRGKALVVGLLLIVAVAGVLVGVLLLPSPPVNAYIVSLPLPLYDDAAVPPVPFAEQDTKLLVECFPENAENAYNAQELDPLRGKLKAIAEGRLRADWGDDDRRKLAAGRPFIFHIAGHAAVANDAVYLLPIKADPADPQTWLPLDKVLAAMADCPTPKKLLLLDLGKPRTSPFLGPLQDDVTPKLHEWLAKKRDTLPCPVLVSCAPGEESYAIPAAGASAFAFYVAEGLRGAADGFGGGAVDKKVKARELAAFVSTRVARWARQNRDLPQQPTLFEPTTFSDFDLMLDVPDPIAEDPEPRKTEFAKVGLADAWAQRAALPPDAARRAAAQLARWASAAVRAEQVVAATAGDTRTGDATALAREWWNEVMRAARAPDAIAYRSLAGVQLPPPGGMPPTDSVAPVRAALVRYAATALPEAGAKVDEKELAAVREAFNAAAAAVPGPVTARVVWDWLLREYAQPKPAVIAFAANATAAVLRATPDLYVEAVALQHAKLADASPFDRAEARGTLMKFLRAEAAASAALTRGAGGFEWVAAQVAAADDAKLKAEQQLFAASSSREVKAADDALDAVLAAFAEIDDRLVTVAAAKAAADDAIRLSAGTALAVAEHGWPEESDWAALAASATALADLVYRKPPADWVPNELKVKTKEVAERAAKFARTFDAAAVKDLIDGAGAARPLAIPKYEALLLTPLVAGADRGKVWDALDQIHVRLHTTARKDGDLDENAKRTITPKPVVPQPLPNARNRRADVGVKLLELAGHPEGKKLAAEAQGIRGADAADRWGPFAQSLREAWGRDGLTRRMKDHADKGEWDALDRLARSLPLGLWQANPDAPGVTDWRVAAAKRQLRDELAYRAWLAAHYRKYATARTDVSGAARPYQNAAAEADRRPRD